MLVGKNEVRPFLNPLTVGKIPGLGAKTGAQLRQMGVSHIYTLCQIDPEQLQRVFGKPGLVLSERAHGIDNSPVVPFRERKSMGAEQTFAIDTTDTVFLKGVLTRMVMELAFQLRTEKKVTGCINVKLRYSDFETVNRQVAIGYTSLDDVLLLRTHEKYLLNYIASAN